MDVQTDGGSAVPAGGGTGEWATRRPPSLFYCVDENKEPGSRVPSQRNLAFLLTIQTYQARKPIIFY